MNAPDWARHGVLLLGAGGMLGGALICRLQHRLGGSFADLVKPLHSADLDIRDERAVQEVVLNRTPSLILNAAGYTNVDGCETHEEEATAVNGRGPGYLAAAAERGAMLVHFSTDFIFDGRTSEPYDVDAVPNPISAYGRSKWLGECAIRQSGCRHLIIRTSWLFGGRGGNFVDAILKRAQSGQRLRVVDDQIGRPTYADDLADATIRLMESGTQGTVHVANGGQCSWHAFAEEIIQRGRLAVPVDAISSDELDRPAKRPPWSVLDTGLYSRCTGHVLRSWQDALGAYLATRGLRTDVPHTSENQ